MAKIRRTKKFKKKTLNQLKGGKFLGEGSYGCVHKPSIHCKTPPNPNFDYKKYVSKIMKTTNAEEELAEFVTIGNIDPTNEYHL